MGITKSENFTAGQNQMAGYAKTLGHPARVAILQYLFEIQTCVCGELVDEIGLAQPTISQHLKELKRLGLIKGNVAGTRMCYCINLEAWAEMKTLLGDFLNRHAPTPDCC